MSTKKVWAQVEVHDGPGDFELVLVGGVDIDRARNAVADLFRIRLGYGMPERFNKGNPFYTPPRSLETVIREDFHRDPDEWAKQESESNLALINEQTTPDRVARWISRMCDRLPRTLNEHALRDRYIASRIRRFDRNIRVLLESTSVDVSKLDRVAAWLGVDPWQISVRTQGDGDQRFFTEAYLYTLLGKDDARTLLSGVRRIAEALGIEWIPIANEVPS